MIRPKYMPFVGKQVVRHAIRSLLTIGGVATAMFLFVAIEAMQQGVAKVTRQNADDTTLVVYRENRFCPFTSRLPEFYGEQIRTIPGVRSVVPMKVVVNNCRASLDVVTFRGVPPDAFTSAKPDSLTIIAGSLADWGRRSDAALLGETLFLRRGLKVGDQFDAAGVTAYVAGVVRSDEPQDQNVAYVHLDFLQQTTDRKLGIVTQFNVKVTDAAQLQATAAAIDAAFKTAEHPTSTRSEKSFVALVAADMIELIGFTRYLGWGCLIAVLTLVCNAIILSVQGRIKEYAILKTLGYGDGLIARLIIFEGIILGVAGGMTGTAAAAGLLHWTRFSMSVDGLSIPIVTDWRVIVIGLVASIAVGVTAGLIPAFQTSRQPIAASFRTV